MARAWTAWAALSAAGGALVVAPDRGPRLLSLSRGHGPSAVDAAGVILLVAGWVVLDLAIWRRRHTLHLSGPGWAAAVVAGLGASLLVGWSVLGDHGNWWVLGASVLASLQLAAAAAATRAGR